MSETMKAVEITTPGGPEVLEITTRPRPTPRPGEVVIRVVYAGVNRPDALQRAGLYAPPSDASDLPGLEAAGDIIALGDGVTDWAIGDQVARFCPAGGMPNMSPHPPPLPAGA